MKSIYTIIYLSIQFLTNTNERKLKRTVYVSLHLLFNWL